MQDIEKIMDGGDLLALIVPASYCKDGLSFITPDDFPLQIGVHNQKKGFKVEPHAHIPMYELKNINAQEAFYIQKGKIKVNLFNKKDKKVREVILNEGDTILLIEGHSVEVLEDAKIIEIKQGPYRGKEKEKRMIK